MQQINGLLREVGEVPLNLNGFDPQSIVGEVPLNLNGFDPQSIEVGEAPLNLNGFDPQSIEVGEVPLNLRRVERSIDCGRGPVEPPEG